MTGSNKAQGKRRIRKPDCKYLAYALIDAIVGHYFLMLEKIGEKIEQLEEDLLGDTQTETLQSIHDLFFSPLSRHSAYFLITK